MSWSTNPWTRRWQQVERRSHVLSVLHLIGGIWNGSRGVGRGHKQRYGHDSACSAFSFARGRSFLSCHAWLVIGAGFFLTGQTLLVVSCLGLSGGSVLSLDPPDPRVVTPRLFLRDPSCRDRSVPVCVGLVLDVRMLRSVLLFVVPPRFVAVSVRGHVVTVKTVDCDQEQQGE